MRVFNKNYEAQIQSYEAQIQSYEAQIQSYEAQIRRQEQFIQDQQVRLLTEQRCKQEFRSELGKLEEKYELLLRNHITMMEKFGNHLTSMDKYISITSEPLNESEGAR